MLNMRACGRQVRVALAACALMLAAATAANASPLFIGTFAWVQAADATQTFELTAFGLDPWPSALALDNVVVQFTRDGGAAGQAFFDADAGCTGLGVTVSAGSFYQSPGNFTGDCGDFAALPQDIVSATLTFTYDTLLGVVTVAPLGPALDAAGAPNFEVQGVFFEAAEAPAAPVPEPASMVLVSSGVAGLVMRRLRRRLA